MDLHERGVHQHSPKWRTNSDGHQLVRHGNLSDDGDFHVTVFFYNKGIVLIQEPTLRPGTKKMSASLTQQDIVNVTLANNSSQLCNSGHLPVTSTPATDTPSVFPAVSRRHSPNDNTQANSVAKISRRSAQPQRLSVSDTTSTTCRGIDSQSLVSDLCYSSGTSDKSLSSTTDCLLGWGYESKIYIKFKNGPLELSIKVLGFHILIHYSKN